MSAAEPHLRKSDLVSALLVIGRQFHQTKRGIFVPVAWLKEQYSLFRHKRDFFFPGFRAAWILF